MMGSSGALIFAVIMILVLIPNDRKEVAINNHENQEQQAPNQEQLSGSVNELSKSNAIKNNINKEESIPIETLNVKVDQLYSELKANSTRATENYKGKIVNVTGKLSSIENNAHWFHLKSESGRTERMQII